MTKYEEIKWCKEGPDGWGRIFEKGYGYRSEIIRPLHCVQDIAAENMWVDGNIWNQMFSQGKGTEGQVEIN